MENETITSYDVLTGEETTRELTQEEINAINAMGAQGANNDN